MVADPVVFRDLAYVFAAAVAGGLLARAARQPLLLGYVVGGLIVSPFTPGPAVSHVAAFEIFAEVGVALLMFSIGIEFSLRDLLGVGRVALVGGPLGMALFVGLTLLVGLALGWPPRQGLAVGIVLSVGSSMVLFRLLLDRGELGSSHGRILVGVSLVEDLAVVVLIVLLPALGAWEPARLAGLGGALARAAAILIPVAYVGWKVVPALMTRVARLHSQELFLLVSLALALGTAAVAQAAGLSVALGAFLGGLLVSESEYAHETLARVLSLRDAFVALFFVTVGALIDPAAVLANLPLLAVMVGLVVAGKTLVRTAVVWLFCRPLATALLVGVGLAQVGEFSFVLVQVARSAGHIGAEVYNATLAASLLTILLNACLVRWVPAWLAPGRTAPGFAPPGARAAVPVVLCGFGRVGSAVGEALETFGLRYAVVESDIDIVRSLRGRGVHAVFGDAGHRRVLEHAGADSASLLVVTVPEVEQARTAVRELRRLNAAAPILARAHSPRAADGLRAAGATEVIQPELEAAGTLIRHALERLSLPRDAALDYLTRFRAALAEGVQAGRETAPALPRLHQVTVARGGLADLSLGEARVRERFGVTVVAVVRDGEEIHNPGAETILRAGDRVTVFGLPDQVNAFRTAVERPE